MRQMLSSGRFWQWFWGAWIVVWLINLPFALTVWSHSLRYLNAISVLALVLSSAGAWQSSLAVRKADPEDPL